MVTTMPMRKLKELGGENYEGKRAEKKNCRLAMVCMYTQWTLCKFPYHPHLTCQQLPLMHLIFFYIEYDGIC